MRLTDLTQIFTVGMALRTCNFPSILNYIYSLTYSLSLLSCLSLFYLCVSISLCYSCFVPFSSSVSDCLLFSLSLSLCLPTPVCVTGQGSRYVFWEACGWRSKDNSIEASLKLDEIPRVQTHSSSWKSFWSSRNWMMSGSDSTCWRSTWLASEVGATALAHRYCSPSMDASQGNQMLSVPHTWHFFFFFFGV